MMNSKQLEKRTGIESLLESIDNTGRFVEYGGETLFLLEDDIGKKIAVNADKGEVYRAEGSIYSLFATPGTSKKADGYLVAVFNYKNELGKVKPYRIRQHMLVALVKYREEYESLMEDNKKIVCCHINGRPWDNRAANLEWGTVGENVKQGKVVNSLEKHLPGVYTETVERPYVDKDGNSRVNKIVILKKGIKNRHIHVYEAMYGKLKVIDKFSLFGLSETKKFARYMEGQWEELECVVEDSIIKGIGK